MIQSKYFWSLFGLFFGLIIFLANPDLEPVAGFFANQTIPTRTPTPPPTATSSNPGGGNPTVTPTPPRVTPTSTLLPVDIAPTPVGGFLPTAVPCSSKPTIQTRGATNVRSGPGINYSVVGELVFLEVRYIVGRAETAEWWLIQFNNGQLGWVADDVVLVQGYTPIVPLVEAPPLANGTPTPGAVWNPTPIPFCTVTPIPTETAPPTAAVSPTGVQPSATPLPTEPPATLVLPTNTPIVQPTAVTPEPSPAATTTMSSPPTNSGSTTGIVLVGLGALAAVGFGVYFVRRRG